MEPITEKVVKILKLTKFDLGNTTIVGNEDVAKQIHKKATQFDHLMSLINGKVFKVVKLLMGKFSISLCVLMDDQLINVVTIFKFHNI